MPRYPWGQVKWSGTKGSPVQHIHMGTLRENKRERERERERTVAQKQRESRQEESRKGESRKGESRKGESREGDGTGG